ncbi:S8 family serine peptidase [Tautonia plasticadhaerens]|uniref:Bacillopeptidase F n=1 Tax=Tautonia plasticadhaerens TaxID=2527974 RepID=A0A518H8H4_9BACT|nr:S8 family serine peptidase [Tautonia plasticadhaerens]QDV37134.1 Bacillopeptidase F precursor [Tautonia plasticadhaerens]
MGSFKGDSRKPGRDRRRPSGGHTGKARGPEPLEERTLMNGDPVLAQFEARPIVFGSPDLDVDRVKNGPLAKAGQHLAHLDIAFREGNDFDRVLAEAKRVFIFRGEKVGIDLYGTGDFATLEKTLRSFDMEVVATDASIGLVEGYIPISRIRDLADYGAVRSFQAIYRPIVRQQGSAANQGDQTLLADQARTQFNVDGSGVTVGVLSDTVNQLNGGLADSIASGDLPSGINVLQDGAAGGSDEGRAMLELIHDIAPGASLAYHTAEGGPAAFGDGIRALSRQAGADIIVDDIGYLNEPVFQDGLVGRAVVDVVTNDGRSYFSAAGNDGDAGYESNVRVATGTVGQVGAGNFHDFDPGAGVQTTIDITVADAGINLGLWWDDPWFSGAADSDLDLFVLDPANGNIVAQAVTNNIGSATPQEIIPQINPGNYQVAIRYSNGPAPARVRFQDLGGGDLQTDKSFGSAGTTTYPTTFAHPTSPSAIGVGAVFYGAAPPVVNPPAIPSEAFTSAGPVIYFFDPNGNRLPGPQLLMKPDVSGPDGVNTSFFGSPDVETPPDGFPNFYGTSAAAPNVAAVAALMKQLNPASGPEEIRDSLIVSATPLNGASPGEYNVRGGFGLVNAVGALTAVDQLRVVSSTPADVATLGSVPSFIELNLSKPVDPASVQSGDLTFPVLPPGVSVIVGAPTLVDSMTVRFPVQIETSSPDAEVNGIYAFEVADAAFTGTDASPLVGLRRAFTVSDVGAPQVTNTIFLGRIVVVEFSEAMRGSTITKDHLMLVRTGGTGEFGRSENVIVTNDERAILFYDAPNNRAIFDLRNLPQSSLPSDVYALVVRDQVRDAAGVQLDGNFSGQFPSGDGQAGGDFAQFLGGRFAAASQIVGFGLDAASDTGIPGDRNTNQVRPTFSGFAVAEFPSTNAGLQVAVQFIQEHPAGFDLDLGTGDRGFVGEPDLLLTTDENGFFSFPSPFDLEDGFHRVRIVIVGEAEFPPLPGNATRTDLSFRVDSTSPLVTASSIPSNSRVSNLRDITLNVADPVSPADQNDTLAVPVQLDFPALDPETATNLGNYSLINLGPDRVLGTADDVDLSQFIENATFVSTNLRGQPTDPYTGRIELTFADGLSSGRYALIARTQEGGFSGIRDAAGNPLDNDPAQPGNQSFVNYFELQPEAAFITNFTAFSPSAFNPGTTATSGPRSFYETPVPGFSPRAEAPPESFFIDFSNTLAPRDYSDAIQLIRSADSAAAQSDGDFGVGSGGGFSRVDGITVELTNSVPGATLGQPGYLNRLVVRVPSGQVLPADYYRVFIPNSGDQEIRDVFGNLADLEFLGNETPQGSDYEVFMPDGTYREGLTGDGVGGGAFVTGFVVAPGQRLGADGRVRGNIIYARPDYEDDPFLTIDDPDGSRNRPFPTLLPDAQPNLFNGGDLNSPANFGTGFNPAFDRNGNGVFDRSAFFEADQVRSDGPVVIVALPGTRRPIPGTTETTQETFVISPPAGADPTRAENNASGSVPEQTTLAFQPGSTLKLFNASLFVQNQGSALQLRGGSTAADQVVFTSLLDDSFGGDTNNDGGDTTAGGGNWGGIVFRNYDDVSNGRDQLPGSFPVDGKLGLSGASDVMSFINKAIVRFGGGAVPQTIGERFDSITLFNSRPDITNTIIADSAAAGGAGGTQAAISADFDSLREDEIARGPLVRRTEFRNNSINGLLIRPQVGIFQAQETDAIFYAPNAPAEGANKNFVIDDPVPYVLASQLVLGQRLLQTTGGATDQSVSNRLYVQPGMMVKFRPGANIALLTDDSSINIGDRTYIRQFDADPNISPEDPNFAPNDVGDAKPLFTSLFDDDAETFFLDQTTGVRRTIVPAGSTDNQAGNAEPAQGNVPFDLRWGNLSVNPGARAVIDEAEFRYGGGNIASPTGTLESRNVLDLSDDSAQISTDFSLGGGSGAYVSVTNNDFFDNYDAPMVVEPDQLLATDPLRPLLSGNPFIRGNLLLRNDVNGLLINTSTGVQVTGAPTEFIPPVDPGVNLTVDSVWDDTDIVHVMRGSILFAGYYDGGFNGEPVPNVEEFDFEERPSVTLTVASSAPDKLLANGDRIARPGESAIVKLLNAYDPAILGPGDAVDPDLQTPGSANNLDLTVGAGWQLGFDDGVDPPASGLIPSGVGSQLRFLGIGGNESLGQQRVPVVVTSLRDASVGPNIRGIDQSNTFTNDPQGLLTGDQLTTPEAGDGGVIAFGGTILNDYNLFDPRNGSLIDNTDLRFLTRIDMQGGDIIDFVDFDASDSITQLEDDARSQKLGLTPATQFNSVKSMTISNSNLSTFLDAGVFVYPGYNALGRLIDPATGTATVLGERTGVRGQAVNLFMVNNTIANMPVAVRVNAETTQGPSGDGDTGQSPYTVTLLHNTFFNNGVGLRTDSPTFDGQNSNSQVYYIGMNNIFDGGTIGADPAAAAVRAVGQNWRSELTFNVFNNYTTLYDDQTNTVNLGNKNVIQGNPNFFDAANGNFFPQSGSVAIDAALSELGPVLMGDALFPISNQLLNPNGGIRNTIGRNNAFGGNGFTDDPREIITLPGTPGRPFVDQFLAVDPRTPGAIQGPSTNLATPFFLPVTGERGQAGFQRIDDPTTANLGFGSRPFFDIGAREFRIFDPPQITTEGAPDVDGDGVGDAVFATVADPTTGEPVQINLYTPGAVQGSNRVPLEITFQFDEQIDAQTINSATVLLQASGGDGVFDNANSPADRSIPLSGRLAFDNQTRRLTIRLASGNLLLSNDLYRIVLVGQGGNVIRDPQGNALDGENLDAAGLPAPLPSGDGFPGGNFVLPFTIDTRAPEIEPGSLRLAQPSDPTLSITNENPPTFTGTVNDVFPPPMPLLGQRVVLDLDIDGDGTFEMIGVGTATTDASGNFTITPSGAIDADTPFNVGADGQLGTADDSGFSRARVRVTDVSGNPSDPDDPNATVDFILDTRGPRIIDATPAPGSLVDAGRFRVSFTTDENLSLASLMAGGAITVAGAGLDGAFGTMDDVAAGIDMSSLNVEFLATSPSGPSRVSFDVTGAVTSDVYRVTITDTVTDRAGNMLDGESTGGFPTGNGTPGGSFSLDLVVFSPGSEQVIFVSRGPSFGTPDGSRANPYPTIAEGLAVAGVGDTVAVLPGTYNEAVTLKSLVRLVSADPSSTDAQVVPGNARQTIIRAPLVDDAAEVTVTGTGLLGLGGDLDTEFRGFAVVAPLSNLTSGTIQQDSTGIRLVNSGGLFHQNLVINAGEGISVVPNGGTASNARIESNLISGNRTGMVITDSGNSNGISQLVRVANNTFALNDGGLVVYDETVNSGSLAVADVVNNIFWQNTNRQAGSPDTPLSVFPPVAVVRSNMFSNNPNNPLLGFDAGALGSVPNAAAAFNFIGDPAFVSPRDARPQFDGPTLFLLDADFDLTANSLAIDAADPAAAPAADLLNRGRIDIPNRGFPGTGPADVGAYEFQASGTGTPGGGVFIPGTGRTASTTSVDTAFDSLGGSNSTFQAGAGVGQASQVSGNRSNAGQARRDRAALRNLLSGRESRADEIAPQGRRPWQDFLLNRPRQG